MGPIPSARHASTGSRAPPATSISRRDARRVALAAQGFAEPRPTGRVDRRHFRRVLDRLGHRAARLGQRADPQPRAGLLRPARPLRPRRAQPVAVGQPRGVRVLGPRGVAPPGRPPPAVAVAHGRRARLGRASAQVARDNPEMVAAALAEIAGPRPGHDRRAGGPPAAPRREASWWGWGDGKRVVEHLFYTGRGHRHPRATASPARYMLPERWLPRRGAGHARRPSPTTPSGRCCWSPPGPTASAPPATWPTTTASTCRRAAALLASWWPTARCVPVRVEGWNQPAYLHPEAHLPRRRLRARALLSPFDSLIWERAPHRAPVRLPLPHRDLRPAAQAGARVLRAAVPARRARWSAGSTSRPTARPACCGCGPRGPRPSGVRPPPAGATGWRPSWPPSWPRMAAWLGLAGGVDVEPRGDLAPPEPWRPRSAAALGPWDPSSARRAPHQRAMPRAVESRHAPATRGLARWPA